MVLKFKQLAERIFVLRLAEPMSWHLLNLCISRVFAEVPVCLSESLPALDVEGGCRTFHILVVDGKLFLSHGVKHIRGSITNHLTRESAPFPVLVCLLEPLELLKIDLKILLAPHPILVILGHLERVLDRW